MTPANAFHRWMTLAEARRQSGPLTITADGGERAAIARRFDLVDVAALSATLHMACDGDTLSVTGTLDADVVQRCVATAEPLAAAIHTDIDVRYVPNARLEAEEAEAEVELGADDLDIIGYSNGSVDLGDMLAETLYLALDLYPRSPDADAWLAARGVKNEVEAGPFGALAALRPKPDGNEGRD